MSLSIFLSDEFVWQTCSTNKKSVWLVHWGLGVQLSQKLQQWSIEKNQKMCSANPSQSFRCWESEQHLAGHARRVTVHQLWSVQSIEFGIRVDCLQPTFSMDFHTCIFCTSAELPWCQVAIGNFTTEANVFAACENDQICSWGKIWLQCDSFVTIHNWLLLFDNLMATSSGSNWQAWHSIWKKMIWFDSSDSDSRIQLSDPQIFPCDLQFPSVELPTKCIFQSHSFFEPALKRFEWNHLMVCTDGRAKVWGLIQTSPHGGLEERNLEPVNHMKFAWSPHLQMLIQVAIVEFSEFALNVRKGNYRPRVQRDRHQATLSPAVGTPSRGCDGIPCASLATLHLNDW